jgi:hypothetical protein
MRFAAAPEYQVFPTSERALKPYAAAVKASAVTRSLIRSVEPDVVVADILTVAAALAAELEERPWATLVPHVLPMGEPGFPVYAVGAVHPRTSVGARLWRLSRPLLMRGEQQGRVELNETRARVGLPPLPYVHGGTSRRLALVATFPQLEYPRASPPPWLRVTGPLLWEQPFGEVEDPPGDDPLILVAPSTSQDPEHRLLRAALSGLADEPAAAHLPHPGAAQRPAGRLGVVRPHDAALRRGGLPRRPRNGGAGAGERNPRRGLPARGRHGGERSPDQMGRPGRLPPPPVPHPARCTARGAPPAGGRELLEARGRSARLERQPRRRDNRRSRTRGDDLVSSGGGTRTHNLRLNRAQLCRLSYPGMTQPA